jgi:hypothetical protein
MEMSHLNLLRPGQIGIDSGYGIIFRLRGGPAKLRWDNRDVEDNPGRSRTGVMRVMPVL